ncbi:methylenetetrahydrofolate reductase [NAD(P)H] [Acetobacter sp. TBRC 12305]|uniref:Methylenetetrahydrofolate reductase n=1 Tax=Acetobacter garciniae TaxID=2817435 RepID=A0A939HQB9_9PROT|nr:methylenetetrahydrofolate reductase [NAD(P)H] [Acetobacter garciniae]MBO1326399.1 methylenetetrahydrofolate reductase [NAD(P)H] [Acetobacter garciniae]MBX0346146.1 methylenetetrahydrofolate reductase [NAD(P)H] [Acetobacter garciniae]
MTDSPSPIVPPATARVSFEFFPPRSDEAEKTLMGTAQKLAAFGPEFVSMTYGAGGSTRERSLQAAAALVRATGTPVAGHLTCVGASREEVNAVARAYWDCGIRHIVALRGDAAEPGSAFTPHPAGYRNAAELVAGLRAIAPFEISVAAYPETHPEAASPQADLDNLRRKLDAGATRAITQFFFTPETFLRFRDKAAGAGITAPIVPGILPIANVAQARRFAAQCGAHMPPELLRQLDGLDADPPLRAEVTTAIAAQLCATLRRHGVEDFHIYTLNRALSSAALCRLLGLPAASAAQSTAGRARQVVQA